MTGCPAVNEPHPRRIGSLGVVGKAPAGSERLLVTSRGWTRIGRRYRCRQKAAKDRPTECVNQTVCDGIWQVQRGLRDFSSAARRR